MEKKNVNLFKAITIGHFLYLVFYVNDKYNVYKTSFAENFKKLLNDIGRPKLAQTFPLGTFIPRNVLKNNETPFISV